MDRVTKPQLVVYAAAALAIGLVGASYLRGERTVPTASTTTPAFGGRTSSAVRVGRSPQGPVVVDVAGAVRRPGVYRLGPGARVDDALRRAGGPTGRADVSKVNLAAKAEDGRQYLVPERVVAGAPDAAESTATDGDAASTTTPVNLNTATVDQLDELDGVGPATAAKIVRYREQHGGFRTVDELDQVPGIGEGRMAALRDHVTV